MFNCQASHIGGDLTSAVSKGSDNWALKGKCSSSVICNVLEKSEILPVTFCPQALLPALKDVSLVFHCASPAPASDDRGLFERVNIQGTRTVIQASMDAGVQVRQSADERLGLSLVHAYVLLFKEERGHRSGLSVCLFCFFARNWS